ncbi:hypothetical protein SCUCBS95973_000605 [Sporothrix curviconia]|uniref:Uncharacterized protein n=1 Tax=Sporothrix curviconia TaxID=1260050 RepID=A0ABP0ARL7_9PEZI
MGKVIILAGAPDAASLDLAAIELKPERAGQSDSSIDASAASALDNPQWRVVPPRANANEAQAAACPEAEIPTTLSCSHHSGKPVAGSPHPHLLRGQAAFLTLTPATQKAQERTQQSTQDETFWQRGSGSLGQPATVSFDETSLSIRLPDALLEETAPQLPPHPPHLLASQATDGYLDAATTSQQFLEYSLALHNALPSSMPQTDLPGIHDDSTSFDEMALSLSQPPLPSSSRLLSAPPLPAEIPRWQPLTHLVDVPNAAHLLSLAPQTVTVNLVVAIVSVGAPRVVDNVGNKYSNGQRNRRPPASLVELVVGDETRSGFGLTIWTEGGAQQQQQQQQQQNSTSSLAALLPTLAPHDIVLLRHVALHVFGDKVYGSSLRKDQTKMHILHRGCLSQQSQTTESASDALFSPAHLAVAAHLVAQEDSGLPAGWQLLEKTARVRDWALQFVLVDGRPFGNDERGAGQGDADNGEREVRPKTVPAWTLPPADTQ